MNPVKQLISQLSIDSTIMKGQVRAFDGQWVLIAIGNRVERWANPGGLQAGDTVNLLNGRIIKTRSVKHLDIFQV